MKLCWHVGFLLLDPGMALEAEWGVGSSDAQVAHAAMLGIWASCSFSTHLASRCSPCPLLQAGQPE